MSKFFETGMSIERDDMLPVIDGVVKVSENDKVISVLVKRPARNDKNTLIRWNEFIIEGVIPHSIYRLIGNPFGGYSKKFNMFKVMPPTDEFLKNGTLILELELTKEGKK